MYIKGGRFVWTNLAGSSSYSEMIGDVSQSKIDAAETRAATALSATTATIILKGAGKDGDPRKGNKSRKT